MAELPKKIKYKLGLALSGGGARGFAHPGALAGVFYADGYTPMHIVECSYHYMPRFNTLLDRTLYDVLVEMKDVDYFKISDLENSEKIFKIGYNYSQQAILDAVDRNIINELSPKGKSQNLLLP